MTTQTRERTLWWTLRIGAAMCFIGHGMFGLITKQEWIPFFAVVGISSETAVTLMPLIGMLDIAIGLAVLFQPVRAVLLYMTVWAVWTASLRPLSGDSFFEFLERAGNYGIPLALLLFCGPVRSFRGWITPASAPTLASERHGLVWRVLSLTTAMLLVGHGGLALTQKGVLVTHAGVIGSGAAAVAVAGAIEIALAVLVLVAPRPALLIGVALWKVVTELLYPVSGAPIWEFIERGGSYAAPLALAILAAGRRASSRTRIAPRVSGLGPATAVLLLASMPAFARAQDSILIAPPGITDSLRAGGFVLACRHAETHHDQSDRGRTRELQRNLTSVGERQAKSIGAAIRALRIPIGEVRSNPMYRNQETATYAFGRMVVDSSLGGRDSDKALRAMLKAPVKRGTNRAIVTRIGILSGAMRDHGVRNIDEGDCFVVQPIGGDDFRVLGRLRVQDWGRLTSM
jgi:hypothetical protein